MFYSYNNNEIEDPFASKQFCSRKNYTNLITPEEQDYLDKTIILLQKFIIMLDLNKDLIRHKDTANCVDKITKYIEAHYL